MSWVGGVVCRGLGAPAGLPRRSGGPHGFLNGGSSKDVSLKREFLELLKSDEEFRLAVMGAPWLLRVESFC